MHLKGKASNSGKKIEEVLKKNVVKKKGLAAACDAVIRACLFLLAFLVPLAFAPFTLEVLEFNKQALIIVLTAVAFLAWMVKMFASKKIEVGKTPLNVMVLAFVAAYSLSSWFSIDRFQSFAGSYDRSGSSFITVLCLVAVFFIAVNNIRKLELAKKITGCLLASGCVAALFGILQISGIHILPMAAQRSFNTVGTVNALAVFCSAILCLAVVSVLDPHSSGKGKKGLVQAIILPTMAGVLSLAVIAMVNYWAVWIVLIVGMAAILVFFNIKIREAKRVALLMIPVAVLLFSILMAFVRLPVDFGLPAEILPSQSATWRVVQGAFEKSPAFGSGPGTFSLEYAKNRSLSINETAFWNTKFNKGGSEYTTLLATTGLAGTISWALANVLLVVLGVFFFMKRKDSKEWFFNAGIFSCWLALLVAKFLYPSNITLDFFSWMLMGVFMAVAVRKSRILEMKKSPRINFAASFLLAVIVFSTGLCIFLQARRYVAEVYYKKAQVLAQKGVPITEIVPLLEKSAAMGGRQDSFFRNLSQAYLLMVGQEISKEPDASTMQNVRLLTDSGIRAAKMAVESSPNNIDNWLALGGIYQNVMPFISGADKWAEEAYGKAMDLEPNNPLPYSELGKVYLIKSDLISGEGEEAARAARSESLDLAREKFEKAIDLKADYTPAHLQLALAFLRLGNNREALGEMELARAYSPGDATIAFQLGVLYEQFGQKDKAVAELERAVKIAPAYSNARWQLASIYERDGDIDKAIEHLKIVVHLNPDNQAAALKLESLTERRYAPPSPIDFLPEEGAEGSGEESER